MKEFKYDAWEILSDCRMVEREKKAKKKKVSE